MAAIPTVKVRQRPPVAKGRKLSDGMPVEPACRITVEQYHEMIRLGILAEGDPIELLEGWLVRKMPKNPPHVVAGKRLRKALAKVIPRGWEILVQDPITLGDSEPEPDAAVVVERAHDYLEHHPEPDDIGLVIEVADSSLPRDKGWKKAVYAHAKIACYWIVNLNESSIEVFTEPNSSSKHPDYRGHQVYNAKQRVPVFLHGKKVGSIAVSEILP